MLKVGAKKRKRPTRSIEKKTLNLRLDKAPERRFNDDDSFSMMPQRKHFKGNDGEMIVPKRASGKGSKSNVDENDNKT